MGHPMRLELARVGLQVKLAHQHATRGTRRSPGGGRVLCREYAPSRLIRTNGLALSPGLVNSASLICDMNREPSCRVSASAYCGCWFDLKRWRSRCTLHPVRSKQLFSVPFVTCRCLSDFLVMIIVIYIYINTDKVGLLISRLTAFCELLVQSCSFNEIHGKESGQMHWEERKLRWKVNILCKIFFIVRLSTYWCSYWNVHAQVEKEISFNKI